MNYYIYMRFLIAELAVVAMVVVLFQVIADRSVAGTIAGFLFLALGFYILVMGLRVRAIRRSGSFAVGMLHLFAVSLPLLITRWMNSDMPFSQVLVLGLPGPAFHRLSTIVYLGLLAATSFDLWRSRRDGKRAARFM